MPSLCNEAAEGEGAGRFVSLALQKVDRAIQHEELVGRCEPHRIREPLYDLSDVLVPLSFVPR
jgi:hypothetical protein